MSKLKEIDSKELGLEAASICGQYFFKLEHLHYGLWGETLELDVSNLGRAQQKYTDFLMSNVPEEVKTVLDVGCGTGKNAARLLDMGKVVDCVSPNPFLSKRAAELLGDRSRIFKCKFEDLEAEHKYDCILFAESFQYVNLDKGFEKGLNLLNDGGYLLICDVFKLARKETGKKSAVGGGHSIDKFFEFARSAGLEKITDEDITDKTAPNIELLDDALKKVAGPLMESTLAFFRGRHPLMTRLLCRLYRKKLEKLRRKYMGEHRTSEDFRKTKIYRLLLYRKPAANPA